MELNVNYLGIDELVEHPKQNEIYGDTIVDDDFIDNIKERGILQNLLVTDGELFGKKYKGKYVIIAGHRRVAGAIHAGMESVPCIIKNYNNIDETTLDFLSTNKQRTKTKQQIFNESENYKKLIQVIKASQIKSNTYNENESSQNGSGTNLSPNENIDFSNPNVQKVLTLLSMGYRQADIVAEQLDIPITELKKLNVIYSGDYMNRTANGLEEKGIDEDEVMEMVKKWHDIRELYSKDEISLHSAYTQIQDMIKGFEKKLKPKEKEKKAKEIKNYKVFIPYLESMNKETKNLILENYKNTENAKYELITNQKTYETYIDIDYDELINDLKEFVKCDIVHFEFMEIADEVYSKIVEYYSILAHQLKIKIEYRNPK